MITGVLSVLALVAVMLLFAAICVGVAVFLDDPEKTRLH